MKDQAFTAFRQDIHWRVALASYAEFCEDIAHGLPDMKSTPAGYIQHLAWRYSQLPLDEAKRLFRSGYYILNPQRAEREWGADSDAPERWKRWWAKYARVSAGERSFNSPFRGRLEIYSAKRYMALRKHSSHRESLDATLGISGVEVDEGCLRKLAAVRLVSAKSLKERLIESGDRLRPLLPKTSRSKDVLMFQTTLDELVYRLGFVIEDGMRGGISCDLLIYRLGEMSVDGIMVKIADPPWDIITHDSLAYSLDLLMRGIRVRFDAVFPP